MQCQIQLPLPPYLQFQMLDVPKHQDTEELAGTSSL